MGWTYSDRWKTREQVAKSVVAELHTDVVASGPGLDPPDSDGRTTFYVAARKDGKTTAHVYLIEFQGYKGMHESMFPYSFDCPQSVLGVLDPTSCVESNKWRVASSQTR